jgi:hypothetical protein
LLSCFAGTVGSEHARKQWRKYVYAAHRVNVKAETAIKSNKMPEQWRYNTYHGGGLRHQSPYVCGIIIVTFRARSRATSVGKALHQAGQLHQVDSTQECPSLTHDDLWIRAREIGPLRRNRPYGGAVISQQEAFAIPVISLADAGKLPPEQWVERMNDPHKLPRRIRRVCILS